MTLQIRYVSEMISSLYLEIGDFRKAEAFLVNALSTVPQPLSADNLKIDPITFKLQMKMADMYLDRYAFNCNLCIQSFIYSTICKLTHMLTYLYPSLSLPLSLLSYHYEKGIEVLQLMARAHTLPHGTRHIVLEKLAKVSKRSKQ